MKHPHDPQYHTDLTPERRAVLDDVCLSYASEQDLADRQRKSREAHKASLHRAAIAAKTKWDETGNPADEAAYLEAFERWIGF